MSQREFTNIAPQDRRGSFLRRLVLPALIVVAGLSAYCTSFSGTFLFDDRLHILGNRRLKVLWPLWETLARRRPVVDYSLGVNYAVGGAEPWHYHAVNLAIHILAALTLYGVIRRTLLRGTFDRRPGHAGSQPDRLTGAASWIAFVTALIWVVHPLQAQSVTYLIQRSESMMGLFYLLTLYCVIRGAEATNGKVGSTGAIGRRSPAYLWYAAAVTCCALGMGCKAVMVTAPLVVLLYDGVFVSRSFSRALHRRWGLYAGLAATWGVLWAGGVLKGVLYAPSKNAHVGFGYKGVTPVEYAFTQFGVLVRYIELSIWPHPLCLDYAWPVARGAGTIVCAGLVIGGIVLLTVWAFYRKPQLGFVGAWFLVILAPTSSFIPIKDMAFEHRMYLSLAAVVALAVIAGDRVLRYVTAFLSLSDSARRITATALATAVVATLIGATAARNRDYHSEVSMWRDVLTKRPSSARASENLGTALVGEGRMAEAIRVLRDSVRGHPRSSSAHNTLGFALVAQGRLDEAVKSFREALRLRPRFARAHLNLGNALSDKGRREEAMEHFRAAVRIRPGYTEARLNLGNMLLARGDVDEAVRQYREILRTDPRDAKAWGNLGTALLNRAGVDQRGVDEAVRAFAKALEINPAAHNVHNSLGIALASQGKLDEAIEEFRQALWLKPDLPGAHFNLAGCLLEKGETAGAIQHYRAALRANPSDPQAHFRLGTVFAGLGDTDAAVEQFRKTLQIMPDHEEARRALKKALRPDGMSSTGP